MRHSEVSFLTAAFVAVGAYAIGFTSAWTHQARQDWRARKAQTRSQRRLFFTGVWQLARYGALALLVLALLVGWVVRDYRDGQRPTPVLPGCTTVRPLPSPSAARCR